MFYQNIKFTLRYILNNKAYSALNLIGLMLGLTISLIVYLIIFQEASYDRFHKNIRHIYQVIGYERGETGSSISMEISDQFTTALAQEVPEFEFLARIPSEPAPSIMINGNSLNEIGIYADSNLFKVFSFKLLKGNLKDVLDGGGNIVISETIAAKYFPNLNPIGQTISIQGSSNQVFTVSGIMEDIPLKSTLKFDFIVPLQNFLTQQTQEKESQLENLFKVYVKLNSGSDLSVVTRKVVSIPSKVDIKEESELFIFPFQRVHIFPVKYKDVSGGGMIGAIVGLTVIGFLILLIACVNYTNLSTALSLKRTKDIGVKKIYGSSRGRLSVQFLLESFLISACAFILGLLIANLIIPWFNRAFNWNLTIKFSDPALLAGLLAILILTTLLSGLYPAFYLSSMNPIKILKGSDSKGRKNKGLRKILVIVQFFFAIILVIISIASIKQINYIKNKDLGIRIDNRIIFPINQYLFRYIKPLKSELLKLSSVESVTFTSQNPLLIWNETKDIDFDEKGFDEPQAFAYLECDFDFVKTMGLSITEGRDFDESLITDSTNFIINQKAAKIIGSGNVVGSRLRFAKKEGLVIGVINDYHMTHMNFEIKPLIVSCNKRSYSAVIIKFKPGLAESGTNEVKRLVGKFDKDPERYFVRMEDAFVNIYKDNVFRIGKLSAIFSLLAMWIACVGLISLSMFNTELRTKEIGIHRVHGAGLLKILKLLTMEYMIGVSVSLFFAIPLAYLVINKLFSRTAYHTEISIWIFLLGGMIVLSIAFLAVGYQAYRLAFNNPAESLKYE